MFRKALISITFTVILQFSGSSVFAAATEITDGVYMAPGISNSYLVVTPEGNVLIDTGAPSTAKRQYEWLRAVDDAPPIYIVLTHAHLDHAGGLDLWRGPDTEVVAHQNYLDELSYQERLNGFFTRRNAAQFGLADRVSSLPSHREVDNRSPTFTFNESFQFSLGGLTFYLAHTPGETSDHLSLRIPELDVVFVGDNFYDSFPNLYTLRGTRPRWALDYVESLDKVIDWKPSFVLSGHVPPLVGSQLIKDRLSQYRDAVLYVHDETVDGMNEGKNVFSLMQDISLPEKLNIGENYGAVAWSVRGIYESYVGWFDEQPETLFSVPQSVIYPDLVELAGGPDRVVSLAGLEMESGDYVRALYLTKAVLLVDPLHTAALELRVQALLALEDDANNYNERAWLRHARRSASKMLEHR